MATKPKSTKRSPAFRKLVSNYEIAGGDVLSTLYDHDAALMKAFLAWARKAQRHWWSEIGADYQLGLRAGMLERLICDEEGEAAVCAFFDQLPVAQRAPIAAAIARLARGEAPPPPPLPPGPVKKAAPRGAPKHVQLGAVRFATSAAEISHVGQKLAALPPEIGLCTDCTTLELEGNKLTALPDEIGDMASLAELDLNKNPLAALPASLARCTELRRLYVGRTKLTSLPKLPKLDTLSAVKASAALLDALAAVPNLRQLCIADSGLTELPASLRKLKKLDYLDFRGNKITKLPSWIGELRVTNFAWNKELPAAAAARLSKLERANRGR